MLFPNVVSSAEIYVQIFNSVLLGTHGGERGDIHLLSWGQECYHL